MDRSEAELVIVQDMLDRAHSGDTGARAELIAWANRRFRDKVHFALQRDNPRIAQLEQTGDVLQWVLIRLHRKLESDLAGVPADAPGFVRWLEFWLALNLRRVFTDLARKNYGPNGRKYPEGGLEGDHPLLRQSSGPERLRRRRHVIHELIGRLPLEEREVIELRYYPERSKSEVARLLGIDRGTLRRLEQKAEERLGKWLLEIDDGDFAEFAGDGGQE